ncbi:MAG: hypothetical protein ACE5FT_00935 [Candidatus Nanoarchaeia archaeon]
MGLDLQVYNTYTLGRERAKNITILIDREYPTSWYSAGILAIRELSNHLWWVRKDDVMPVDLISLNVGGINYLAQSLDTRRLQSILTKSARVLLGTHKDEKTLRQHIHFQMGELHDMLDKALEVPWSELRQMRFGPTICGLANEYFRGGLPPTSYDKTLYPVKAGDCPDANIHDLPK